MSKVNFKPLKNRVLVLPKPVEMQTTGGIILSDEDRKEEDVKEGTVIAVGSQVDTTEIKPNDYVLYSKYIDTKVVLEGIEYIIMIDDDIYGISNPQ